MSNSSNSAIVNTVENISKKITQINKDDKNIQVGDIYQVSSDTFKGNVANLSSEGTNYIYVNCESAADNTTNNLNKIEINVSNLKNEEKYVYNLDNITNNLILVSSVGLDNAKNNLIEIQPQSGTQYVIADTKMEALKNNDWNKINNEWIYVKDGHSVTGWTKASEDKWYYMNTQGIMQNGWIKDNETWYHLSSNGAMNTGWIKDTNGKWYYLNANGSMASNTTIDGYKVDESGAWIK